MHIARQLPLTRIGAAVCALVGVTGVALLATGGPVSATSPTPECVGTNCIVTFSTPGVGQTWIVPAGVTSETITLYGAVGASEDPTLGGDGAEVTGTLSSAAGTTLTVDVGGAGNDDGTGGINGGGGGYNGGGGGGSSDVELAGNIVLDAGGGGGAGGPVGPSTCGTPATALGGQGGNADSDGVDGENVVTPGVGSGTATLYGGGGGGPGTVAGGGPAGIGGTGTKAIDECNGGSNGIETGSPGVAGAADAGASGTAASGGGGGGGYFGGGTGGQGAYDEPAVDEGGHGGGGGGASYPAADLISDTANVQTVGDVGSVNFGDGEVIISYVQGSTSTTPSTTPATTPPTVAATTTTTTEAPAGATGSTGSTGSTASSNADPSSGLAFTGFNAVPLLLAGGGLIATGALLLLPPSLNRRKRSASSQA